MKDKIEVTVCTGTACYLMGAADVLTLKDLLSPQAQELLELKAVRCMDLCRDMESGRPPFVKVNGKLIAEATVDKVAQLIDRMAQDF